MSGLENYPNPQENNQEGEEKMNRAINPIHLKSLKEARKQLCEEGVVIEQGVDDDDEKIIERALDNEAREISALKKVSGTYIEDSTLLLPELEKKYRQIMKRLNENPEEWESGGITPDQRKAFASIKNTPPVDNLRKTKKAEENYDAEGNYIGPILTSAQAIFEAEERRKDK